MSHTPLPRRSRLSHLLSRARPARRGTLVAIVAVASAFAITACSSGTSAAAPASTAAGSTGATSTSVLSGENFTVAVQSAWPPIGFLDASGNLQGVSIDVAAELTKRLGVTFTFEKPAFSDMIPGVQSAKYDFGLWSADVTADRMKTVDQLSWMKSGYYLEAPAGSSITAGDDLAGICGMTVAIVNGQTTQTTLDAASATCTTAGKGAITVLTFADQPTAELAVKSSRADLATVGSQTYGYTNSLNPGTWALASGLLNPVLNGMVFKQGSAAEPIVASALNDMIADGTYASILKKWNTSDSAIKKAEIDPALG